MNELDTVVSDAVDDAAFDASTPDPVVDTSSDPIGDVTDPSSVDTSPDPIADPLADPAIDPAQQDEFEKRWGIPARSITGRENRIPHSRVKQMVSKAEADAAARLTKELEAKWTSERTPLETKVKDYEDRLTKVAQFEHVLENDPRTFLSLLSQIPAYKEFFDYVNRIASGAPAQQPQPTLTLDGEPQPDMTYPDGTTGYSMEGLRKRDEWLARQIEARAVKQAEEVVAKRYAPIEQEWQQQQRIQQIVPVIEKQIAEARTWPHFTELEPEVIKLLKADPNITLDRAYVKAFQEHQLPKLTADRNRVRTELLAELRQKPVSSSAPVAAVRANPAAPNPNRSIEEIIKDSLREAGHQI